METAALEVLFEDAHCLAVMKPAGLAVQAREPGEDSLEAVVRRYLRPDDPSAAYVGIVHRLDRPASGAIVWAKTAKAARRLADQFAKRAAHKEYWAIVAGAPATERGLWEDWLCLDQSTGLGRVQTCSPKTPRARHARTRYERGTAARLLAGCAWLRLWPETGRTHQLRVQTAARGLPIVGDHQYGSALPFPAGIALHARSVVLEHPILHKPMKVSAPVPVCWIEAGIVLEAGPPDM